MEIPGHFSPEIDNERLERRFRFPKLCTCAGMRRRYPGHQSYSLSNLCETYDINLKDHHRALCEQEQQRSFSISSIRNVKGRPKTAARR